jgi:hypothetical protein
MYKGTQTVLMDGWVISQQKQQNPPYIGKQVIVPWYARVAKMTNGNRNQGITARLRRRSYAFAGYTHAGLSISFG